MTKRHLLVGGLLLLGLAWPFVTRIGPVLVQLPGKGHGVHTGDLFSFVLGWLAWRIERGVHVDAHR